MRAAAPLLLLFAACGGGQKLAPSKPARDSTSQTVEAPATQPAAPEPDPWEGRTDLILPPPPAPAAPVKLPEIERFTLPNGLKVLVVASRDLPVVTLHLAVGAGAEDEPRDKRTLAEYTAQMLTKGTARRGADQIAAAIDFIGGNLTAASDLEATRVTCTALAKDLATCLTLLPEVVVTPSFPQDEMRRVAEQLISALRLARDNPEALAREHFDNLLWGDDHVRGWPPSIEAVQAITRKDLVKFHQAHFTPANSMLAVAGDVDPRQLRADLGRVFAGWKKRKTATARKLAEPAGKGIRVRLVDKPDQTQSQIVLGHLGIAHADADYLPTVLMNYALGGGGGASRLFNVVRVKGGKSYGAHSDFERWRTRGSFQVSTFTRTPETSATLELLIDEIARMQAEGPTEAELAAAKANLAGAYPLRFQSAGDVARAVLAAELHGLGEDYVREYPVRIDAVTLEQARQAAKERLDPENLAVVIVGKAEEVGPQLDRAGLVHDKVGWLEPVSARVRAERATPTAGALDPKATEAGKRLLDAALAAKGGEAKLRAIKELIATGTVKLNLGGQSVAGPWTRVLAPPDRMSIAVDLAGIANLRMVITPGAVFQVLNGTQVRELPAHMAADMRDGLWRDHDFILLRHLEPTTQVQAAGKTTVAGKAYDTVILRRGDGSGETRVLIDPATKMVFRLVYQEGGAQGLEEYADYREVDGVQLPFKQHAEGVQENLDVTVSEYKVNAGLPPGAFELPKQTPAK